MNVIKALFWLAAGFLHIISHLRSAGMADAGGRIGGGRIRLRFRSAFRLDSPTQPGRDHRRFHGNGPAERQHRLRPTQSVHRHAVQRHCRSAAHRPDHDGQPHPVHPLRRSQDLHLLPSQPSIIGWRFRFRLARPPFR